VNQGEINAVVPTQAPAGTYDLVVVNPTGEVGLLQNAYQSLATGPPVITDVTPQSIVNGGGQTLTIAGSGLAGGSVSVDCKALAGTDVADPTISAQSCNDTSCSVTLDAGSVPTGSVCVITVTGADSSTFARFSAIGVTSPSLNLANPSAGQPMITGRRALASAALRANSVSRFLYAAGGDGGQAQAASPFATTEVINVNLFGLMDPAGWRQNRESLQTPRAFMGTASIGRYFYVLGGTDGSQDLATGERTMLLAPEEAPKLVDTDLCLAGGTRSCFGVDGLGNGLEPGDYSYRVSALIDAADPVNLGGETLASDPIIFKLSTIGGRNLIVKLTWAVPVDKLGAPLSGVIGYRVYRTPKDGVSGQGEVLLGEVSAAAPEFIDDGTLTLGADAPLPLGSTSAWQALPAMSTARRAPAGAAGRDPSDAASWYVYALQGTGLRTYEYLAVTLQPNERQSVATAWTAGAQAASVERHEFGAWAVSSRNTSLVTGADTFVFLGGGRSTAGGRTGAVEAGLIQAGGDLGVFNGGPDDMSPIRGGYAAFVVSSKLFVFGGAILPDGTPQPSAIAAQMSSPMPGLVNWNNEGITLTSPRNLLGSSLESAFIFLMGGEAVAAGPALQSTESLAF
jgi:hypothetical protein